MYKEDTSITIKTGVENMSQKEVESGKGRRHLLRL